ncbi:MAG: winged helix-turn-helix transcriptional regulator [Lachnospiraceae bacterium]|nr:winged helix-turn-helix transcriptional regulator [Lachnospiraceae bacterium]
MKQNDLAKMTGKSLSAVKRIMDVMQEKGYVRRVNGKRYGKYWWMYQNVTERESIWKKIEWVTQIFRPRLISILILSWKMLKMI